ncbi:N-acetyltransferase domain-containing protein [Haematococcus lacustris]|uniref:N-acetyltransferase domain-containing protein n=1 Tax=Haematococcus lacustris TaxID=44745 RepID=A0A6A0A1H4_HAELA|nr:N-acetyltransferase domain-containing protein [Haematococcus lacustris]
MVRYWSGALAWRRSWSSRLLVGACLAAAAMCRLLGHGSVLLPLCLATTSGAVYFIGPLLVYSSLNRKMQAIIAKSEMRDIRTNWASHNSRAFLVADLAGQVVGATAVHLGSVDYPSEAPVTEDDLQGSVASIFRMTIDSSVRRAGIGSKLLGAAEEYAKARGYQSMLLHTANQAASGCK